LILDFNSFTSIPKEIFHPVIRSCKRGFFFNAGFLDQEFDMCGIVGYCGSKQAAPILLEGLSKLEYRGYDSAGLAVRKAKENIQIVKATGKLIELYNKTEGGALVQGTCGIGHTRWATHGEPTVDNAHPHCSDDCFVVGIHNGIIENYQELKEKLTEKGYTFYSKTDTEIAVKLVDYYYRKTDGNPVEALSRTMLRVRGSYAFAMMFKDFPDEIYVARKDSPLILGISDGDTYLASDVPAILKHTRDIFYIDNLEIARLTKGEIQFFNIDQERIEKQSTHITWDAQAAEKAGYEHFMIKEIHEQPTAIRNTIRNIVHDNQLDFSVTGLSDAFLQSIQQVDIVACGSAYHVGLVAQYVIEDLAKIPVRVELASEFRYRNPILDQTHLVVVISQSGETADTLAALREAKKKGVKTLAIVNVVGSSIAREADYTFFTLAGPEIAVATTKAYSAQLVSCYLLALKLGQVRARITEDELNHLIQDLMNLPYKIETILQQKEPIQWFASQNYNAQDVFFIGRGLDYAISMEGSLKLKEISYIHSEAYAAGELKHGTISLIEDGTLVIGILTQVELMEKTVSNLMEVKSRGGYIVALTSGEHTSVQSTADFTIQIPEIDKHFTASLAVVPLQLLSYYISVSRGLDVDKPRNLAKSVTVE
jgi:glucosamine--fructose-6-phosphate aminotransferase (isomerizing)